MQWFYLALECVLWQDPVNKVMNFWFLENAVHFLTMFSEDKGGRLL